MSFCYKRLWKLLIDRDMTRADLRRITGISTATFAKLSKGEDVHTTTLARICGALKCKLEDIAEVTPNAQNMEAAQ